MRRTFFAFAACLLAFAAIAHGAETGEAQAQALAQQLQTWLTGLIGPLLPQSDPPVQVLPEGDHFRVAIPVPGATNDSPSATLSAAARPTSKGRWSISDVRVPPTLAFTDHSASGKPPTAYTITIEDERADATLDPALRTPSKLEFDLNELDLRAEGPKRARAQHTDHLRGTLRLYPSPGGTLTVAEASHAEGVRFAARPRNGPAVALGADQVETSARFDGLNESRVAPAIAAAAAVASALPMQRESDHNGAKGERSLTPEARAALLALIDAMQGLLSGLEAKETLSGTKLEIAGLGRATVRRATLGLGGEAPQGVLRAWVDIELNGLAILGLPQAAAALAPTDIALRPTVWGLPLATLDQLARSILEAQGPSDQSARSQAALGALLATQGLTLGIDALAFSLGPARFKGAGSVMVLGPGRAEGHARLTATGFDALTDKARTAPDLARALPVLLIARGLAKPEGDRLVWDVMRAPDGNVSINGIDLSSLRAPGPQPGDRR